MSVETIGIMEGAYFVSRSELLRWINDFLGFEYTKVEQVCTGVAFCQFTDALFPGKFPLHKVNFNAKTEVEFIRNFKILQESWDRLGVVKAIDIPKLVKGKYQDNLEFCQWMKRYFDIHYAEGTPYDAVERRKAAMAAYAAATRSVSASRRQTIAPSTTATKKTVPVAQAKPLKSLSSGDSKENAISNVPAKAAVKPAAAVATSMAHKTSSIAAGSAPAAGGDPALRAALDESQRKVASLRLMIDTLEKERNFYYSRLREVELLCQTYEDQSLPFRNQVLAVLYKSDAESQAETTADSSIDVSPAMVAPVQ